MTERSKAAKNGGFVGATIEVAPLQELPYIQVSRKVVRADLEWDELGLHVWLTSHQPGFKITTQFIIKNRKGGPAKIYRMLASLEREGLLVRTQPRLPNGRMGEGVWYVYHEPQG